MKKNNILILIIFVVVLSFSCSKKKKEIQINKDETQIVEINKKNHEWYYFNDNGYFKTDKVSNIPQVIKKPWTEAVRSSSSNIRSGGSNESETGFAIINRLGMLIFENKNISLSKDINLFSDRTAQNLSFYNGTPIFSVYKSSFFNDTVKDTGYMNNKNQHLFLIQYDEKSNSFYPIINCNNISQELNSEVTDYFWDGMNWYCSIKTITDVKNNFSYVKWNPSVPLLSLSPLNASKDIVIQNISADEYRRKMEYIDYSKSPEQIRTMLSNFDTDVSFYMNLKIADSTSCVKYHNDVKDKKELNCVSLISKTWSGVLFEDGTFFIKGALSGKYILRGYKPVAIKLPKLTDGFVYSDFLISGTMMYVFFEEKDFYEVGRNGFLAVNLEETLYKEIGVSGE